MPSQRPARRNLPTSLLLAAGLLVGPVVAATAAPGMPVRDAVEIRTLSNRADLVSGGDALVEVMLPAGARAERLRVTVQGRDVSDAFAVRPDGRILGLVDDLAEGENTLVADAPGLRGARLTVTNHPIGGPVFSGTQVQPWACTTERHGLGAPLDEQCNAPTLRRWRYRTMGGSYADYDPADPPTDVATTTTDQGTVVPYVFLVETGAMNRGIYRFAILADPEKPITPWNPPSGWNGGVYYKFGPSCGTQYSQGDPSEGVEDNRALSQGYAVATASLSVLGTNCNTVTSAESLMMLQEHMIEQFGPIRHTRGKGGSGGSIGQHVVASGYPGLLQGLNVDLSFEDFWTTLVEVADCRLLLHYFQQTSPHLWPDVRAQGLVTGHMTVGTCLVWENTFASLLDPTTGCGAGQPYHPTDNPGGCRATVQDLQVSVFGRRPPESWSPAEQAAGFGFAHFPYDNTGRLYGLNALRSGEITPEQFVDLNERVGGLDVDSQFVAERNDADPAVVETLYRAGLVASGQTLSQVPIIDIRAATGNAEFHTNVHSWAMRQRLVDAQGHHDNQSIWQLVEVPNLPSVAGPEGFRAMSEWLHAIDADTSDDPIEEKIRRNRPEGAQDSCIVQDQKSSDTSRCAALTYYGTPLIASGGPASNDVVKCALEPLSLVWPADGSFGQVPFTPTVGPVLGQWDRLRAAFPDGVCDFRQPGIGQVAVEPWTTFAGGPGGRPLGPEPSSTPIGPAVVAAGPPGAATVPLPATGGGLAVVALAVMAAATAVRRVSRNAA